MRPEHSECPCPVCAQFRHSQDVDGVLLVAVGVAVALVGLVWLAGQVAGLLAGGGWPEVALADLPSILARLPKHLADPPRRGRRRCAGGCPIQPACTPPWHCCSPCPCCLGRWQSGCAADAPLDPGRPRPAAAACTATRAGTGERCCDGEPAAGQARRPRVGCGGRAGTGRHQPRGGPPLRHSSPGAHPPVRRARLSLA
jgi:hypothetical protein